MRRILAVALLLLPAAASAEMLDVGSTLAIFSLKDQFGEEHSVDRGVRAILFAEDMQGGELVRDALAESGAELLAEADAVYVANVSEMPALIRRLFALPKMRRRGYPVLLDTEGTVTRDFPGSEGRATLIQLKALEVVGIRHCESAASVRDALRALGPEPVSPE